MADRIRFADLRFTYLKVIGWGWFYLSTILNDFSRTIIAWKLCETVKVGDVTQTLDLALQASGLDRAKVIHRPRLLSDNGPSTISAELAQWLDERDMDHVRGAPRHPQTQGKIERWHQTPKNRILLESYYLPGDLEIKIEAFVQHYDRQRYHESLGNLTPADVYFGRGKTILLQRERIKRATIKNRRLQHQKNAQITPSVSNHLTTDNTKVSLCDTSDAPRSTNVGWTDRASK